MVNSQNNRRSDKWFGMRIFFVGFAIALVGFSLGWVQLADTLSSLLSGLGWLIGIVGLGVHFQRVVKKHTAAPETKGKQPWEN